MTSLAVAVRVRVGLPPVPVTVKVYLPLLTLDGTVTVSADVLVAGLGLKEPVAPAGRPLMDSVTGELNPPDGVIVTV